MATVQEVTQKINAAAEALRFEPNDDVNKIIRFGMIESGAGNDSTCFSTWFFGGGDLRHIAAYAHYVIWFAQHNESFTLAQLKEMTHDWIKQPAEFCGYCGFKEIWALTQEMLGCLKDVQSKDELVELLNSIWRYASGMNNWVYQYIPWGVAYLFPIRDEKYFEEGLRYARMK